MHLLFPLLILAAESSPSIERKGPQAVEIYHCDFVQQRIGAESRPIDKDFDAWPDGWKRRRGRGYPTYLKIGIVEDATAATHGPEPPGQRAKRGANASSAELPTCAEQRLKIELDGGAAAVFTPVFEVNSQFAFAVQARVCTEGLEHDEAFCAVSFYDAENRLLERRESPRVRTAGSWRTLHVGPVSPPGQSICRAVIGLHVEPTQKADLRGAVWFDEVRMTRLPLMSLSVNSPHHVYTDPQTIIVTCEASGVRDPEPRLQFRVYDVSDRLIDAQVKPFARQSVQQLNTLGRDQSPVYKISQSWKPAIREPGYYRVTAEMQPDDGPCEQRELSLAVLGVSAAAPTPASNQGQFGWTLPGDDSPLSLESLASLVSLAGVQWVKLPVGHDAQDQQRGDRLSRFIDRVEQQGVRVVGVLDRPPAEAAFAWGETEAAPIASAFVEDDAWHAQFDPVIFRLAPTVRWWQVGGEDDTSFVGFPRLEAKIQEVRQHLEQFGKDARIGFAWPWAAVQPAAAAAPVWRFLAYTVGRDDPQLTAAEISRNLAALRPFDAQPWVGMQPLPHSQYSLQTRAQDLVERMLAAKIGGAAVTFVPRPFAAESGLMNADGTPGKLFPVWRTAASLLAGAEYLGSLETQEHSHNHVFARGGESFLVIWNERPIQETLYLGENVRQFDLWGREHEPSSHDGQHTIEVGPLPTFITGVNTAIAQMRMSFQFETPRLDSIAGRPQRLAYRFTNPFPHSVNGRMSLHAADMLSVGPPNARVTLAASESRRDELDITLLPTANSGHQQVRVDFEITAEREYRFSIWRTLEIGLEHVDVEINTRLDDAGRLVVEQQFTNRSPDTMQFLCQLLAPGRPRVRRPALELNPGVTTLTDRLAKGEELLGQTLILRAEEIDGGRALNYRFQVK